MRRLPPPLAAVVNDPARCDRATPSRPFPPSRPGTTPCRTRKTTWRYRKGSALISPCVSRDIDQPFFVAFGSAVQHTPAHNYLMVHGSIAGTFLACPAHEPRVAEGFKIPSSRK